MATIYNRPAAVESVHSDVARVRFEDNGVLGFVPVGEVADDV